jgi:predicted transcriptional regulator
MKIEELKRLLNATVICGNDRMSDQVHYAFASDLMSDVLTLDSEKMLLITGLCNTQTLRTAEMADIYCILFVRGKKVTPEMKVLANENNMIILECCYSMFKTAGILFSNGLKPVY